MKTTTMKRNILAALAVAASITACDLGKKPIYGYEAPADNAAEADSTIYGYCGPASTNSRLQLITSTNDTIYIDVEEARKNNKVMAGYSKGDELYVLATRDSTKAIMTINKNNLLGEWVMPSPYDGSSPSGIVLKDGGEAESFQQQGDILYKSWRISNGKLLIEETRDDDTGIFYTQAYEIVKMTKDSLLIKNSEESFEYGRFVPEPYEDLGIKFDDDEDDNILNMM